MDVEEGWNDIRIQFKKTKAGFGGQFGTWIGKWDMYTLPMLAIFLILLKTYF